MDVTRRLGQDLRAELIPANPTDRRIQAAFSLGHDPRVEQRQLWDLSLRRGIPELARDYSGRGNRCPSWWPKTPRVT